MSRTLIICSILLMALPYHAAAQQGGAPAPASRAPAATAEILTDTGSVVGRADLAETPAGVLITVQVSGLLPGVHALHIHTTGRCQPPSFTSAGRHFNPEGRAHGFENPDGPHAGDLPNIYVPETQFLKVDLFARGLTLAPGPRSLLDADGSALVIHSGPDDYRTDPAGVSGSRVACGIIRAAGADDVHPRVVTQIRSLTVPMPEPRDVAGRRVELADVQVRGMAGQHAFWIGTADGAQLLVLAEDAGVRSAVERLNLSAGRTVDIDGVLDVLPSTSAEAVTRAWNLRPGEAERLRDRRVVVRATRIAASD